MIIFLYKTHLYFSQFKNILLYQVLYNCYEDLFYNIRDNIFDIL